MTNDFKSRCSIVDVMEIIGGKWKIGIIWYIGINGKVRYNELRRSIGGITNTMLTRSLVTLAQHKIIERVDFKEIPPRVEYNLTEQGKELFLIIMPLDDWGDAHKDLM